MKSHLELLGEEHLQLQNEHADLKKRYEILEASLALERLRSGNKDEAHANSFVARLLDTVVHLYNSNLYSDISIDIAGQKLFGHKIVIAARTDYFGDLTDKDVIEFEGLTYSVATVVLKWMYTDVLENELGDEIILDVLSAAMKFRLDDLKKRCESLLIGRVDIDNCIKIYTFAESANLDRLRDCCEELVSSRWDEFGAEHFADMAPALLYKMLK
ncbi:FYVE zinc finger family protein, partial [Aphelenchoides avenae]